MRTRSVLSGWLGNNLRALHSGEEVADAKNEKGYVVNLSFQSNGISLHHSCDYRETPLSCVHLASTISLALQNTDDSEKVVELLKTSKNCRFLVFNGVFMRL